MSRFTKEQWGTNNSRVGNICLITAGAANCKTEKIKVESDTWKQLLLFSPNKDMTSILEKMQALVMKREEIID